MRSFRERYAALNKEVERREERRSYGIPIESLESGFLLHNDAGSIFVAETLRSDPHVTQLVRRAELRSDLYLANLRNTGIVPEDILFLDTETTGLAGGTGTHAFLVGVGYFQTGSLVLRQYFMRSPAEEIALLEELRELMDGFRLLVTFNGKSFDWPLIDTRFVLHGYRLQFEFDHLDLLHPARRIWKHRLASCSLTSLEQGVFDIRREGDVPGYLIPHLYFDYLRDGDASRLAPVFHHNREDIVTLARLLELLLQAEESPEALLRHDEDRVGLGLALLAAGDIDRGYQTLSSAVAGGTLPWSVRRRAETELWRLMKRGRRAHEGLEMLEAMCQESARINPVDLFPFVELAKFYEHNARDYSSAEAVIERALRLVEFQPGIAGRDDLLHRLRRIRHKRAINLR